MALGLLVGTYYVWREGRRTGLTDEKVLDAALLVIAGGLIGARVLYVLSNLPFFLEEPGSAFAFWQGGLSFWGALVGGIMTIFISAKKIGWPLGAMLDVAAPALALGSFFGYIGALLGGSSYGGETSLPWGVRVEGLPGLHHPSQLLEALVQLGLFWLLLRLRSKGPFSGYLALVYLVLYSIARFGLEFLRGDQTHLVGPFSQAHLLSLLIGAGAAVLLYLRLARLQGSWRANFWR